MFSVKITKKIIQNNLSSFLDVFKKVSESDIDVNQKNIIVRLFIKDFKVNFFELTKMIQQQIVYELNEKTDSKDYAVDFILGEN